MLKKLLSKILDVFIICFNLVGILAFIVILFYSFSYWTFSYSQISNVNQKIYQIGILVAIAAAVLYFEELFIKGFAQAFKDFITREERY